jgi:hypothetical protein
LKNIFLRGIFAFLRVGDMLPFEAVFGGASGAPVPPPDVRGRGRERKEAPCYDASTVFRAPVPPPDVRGRGRKRKEAPYYNAFTLK